MDEKQPNDNCHQPDLTQEQRSTLNLMHVIQAAGSHEVLLMLLAENCHQQMAELGTELEQDFAGLKREFIKALLVRPFMDDEKRWVRIADDPAKFNAEMENVFRGFSRSWRKLHGLPDHRPSRYQERDRKIWRMRQSDKSFDEIAMRFGLTRNAAEQACRRHERRAERQTKLMLDLCRTRLEESGFFDLQPATRVN